MKFRVYYSDQLGRGEEIIDAPDLRSAAKQYYDAHPRVEHCRITVELKGFRHDRVEQFETIEFMEGAKPPPLPSQALAEQPPSTLSSSRVPKMPLIAIAGAMLVFGFAFSLLVITTHRKPEYANTGTAIFYFMFGAVVAGYLGLAVICGFKGKPIFTAIALLAPFLPLVGMLPGYVTVLLPVIGAIRLAKPHSSWARKYYGENKMRIARDRFPKAASVPRQ